MDQKRYTISRFTPEKMAASKEYYKKHTQEKRAASKKYYKNHTPEKRTASKEYYNKHTPEKRASMTKYNKELQEDINRVMQNLCINKKVKQAQ